MVSLLDLRLSLFLFFEIWNLRISQISVYIIYHSLFWMPAFLYLLNRHNFCWSLLLELY